MKIRNSIEYCVSGRYALFSDPINRMGGRKAVVSRAYLSGVERDN